MDPLLVMPPELIQMVVTQLQPADLLALSRVSRAWRGVARDPALWRDAHFRVPGTAPALLFAAPCIGRLDVEVAAAHRRHVHALVSGQSAVKRLTCLGGSAEATLLKQLLWHCTQTQALQELSVSCDIVGSKLLKNTLLESILRMRLSELSLHHVDVDATTVLPAGRQPCLRRLVVSGRVKSPYFAQSLRSVIRANRATLRTLELPEVFVHCKEIESEVLECRGLTKLSIHLRKESPTPPQTYFEKLLSNVTEITDLELGLPCTMDSADQVAALGAALQPLARLRRLDVTVLCSRPQAREARVEANEAALRAALQQHVAVRARCRSLGPRWWRLGQAPPVTCACVPPPNPVQVQPVYVYLEDLAQYDDYYYGGGLGDDDYDDEGVFYDEDDDDDDDVSEEEEEEAEEEEDDDDDFDEDEAEDEEEGEEKEEEQQSEEEEGGEPVVVGGEGEEEEEEAAAAAAEAAEVAEAVEAALAAEAAEAAVAVEQADGLEVEEEGVLLVLPPP